MNASPALYAVTPWLCSPDTAQFLALSFSFSSYPLARGFTLSPGRSRLSHPVCGTG